MGGITASEALARFALDEANPEDLGERWELATDDVTGKKFLRHILALPLSEDSVFLLIKVSPQPELVRYARRLAWLAELIDDVRNYGWHTIKVLRAEPVEAEPGTPPAAA